MSGRIFFLDLAGGRVVSATPDGGDLKTIVVKGRKLPDGLRPAPFWAVMAGLTELSGVLIAIGLLSPLGELGVIASMLMAIITAPWPRFFVTKNGIEYPLVLLVTALAVGISGPGMYLLEPVVLL